MPNEPSMEEILSSIKRIIAEEDVAATGPRAPRRSSANAAAPVSDDDDGETFPDDDQILELTDALPGENDAEAAQEEPAMTAQSASGQANAKPAAKAEAKTAKPARPKAAALTAPETDPVPGVMSDMSAEAARESLVNLSKLLVRPDEGQSNTLEGLVREMLRPMLKEWLDANLPDLVEGMVKREIDRITGRV